MANSVTGPLIKMMAKENSSFIVLFIQTEVLVVLL